MTMLNTEMGDQPQRIFSTVKPVWRVAIDHPLMGAPALARVGKTTLATFGYGGRSASTGGLLVLDAATGAEVWRADAGAGVEGGATVSGVRALFGDQQGRLHCVDLAARRKLWETPLEGAIVAAPLVNGGRIAIGTSVGLVAWLDEGDGRVIAASKVHSNLVTAQPTHVTQEARPPQDHLRELRQQIAKSFDLEELKTLCEDLGVDFDDIKGDNKTGKARELVKYFDRRGQLEELIAWCEKERPRLTWRPAWQTPTRAPAPSTPARQAARITGTPVFLPSGDVAVGALDGGVYRLDALGFKLTRLFDAGSAVYASPLVTGDDATALIVLATQGGDVLAIDEAGPVRWRFTAGNMIRTTPALAGGALYFGANDRNAYALNVEDGRERWRFSWRNSFTATPLPAPGRVVLGDTQGRVFALDEATRAVAWLFDAQADRPGLDGLPAAVFGGFALWGDLVLFGAHNGCAYAVRV